MVAAAPSANDTPRTRRPWTPDGDAHLIFQWVKLKGKTQAEVASMLGISQATVSRVVQRYERWQAHAAEREGGRLDPSERLRAQRWLTFERNEVILASCLRLAGEMEGFVDTSKSTISRSMHNPAQESEIRTQHAVIDRSGMAARFLRLAFRINMEQLKLAQLDQPPPAEPLSAEEIAAEERAAAADAEELARARKGLRESSSSDAERENATLDAERRGERSHAERGNEGTPAPVHNVNNLHTADAAEIGATAAEPCHCVPQPAAGKNLNPDCIADRDGPPWSDDDRPTGAKCRHATAAAT